MRGKSSERRRLANLMVDFDDTLAFMDRGSTTLPMKRKISEGTKMMDGLWQIELCERLAVDVGRRLNMPARDVFYQLYAALQDEVESGTVPDLPDGFQFTKKLQADVQKALEYRKRLVRVPGVGKQDKSGMQAFLSMNAAELKELNQALLDAKHPTRTTAILLAKAVLKFVGRDA